MRLIAVVLAQSHIESSIPETDFFVVVTFKRFLKTKPLKAERHQGRNHRENSSTCVLTPVAEVKKHSKSNLCSSTSLTKTGCPVKPVQVVKIVSNQERQHYLGT